MENEKQAMVKTEEAKEQAQQENETLTVEELEKVSGGLVPFPRLHYPLVEDSLIKQIPR